MFFENTSRLPAAFLDWTHARPLASLSTNAGSATLAFQSWRRFKESFAPELVARAVADHPTPVRAVLDPFGGSGSTAVACQFLGVAPTIIEVNPYLADLIEAKLSSYDTDEIAASIDRLFQVADRIDIDPNAYFEGAPATFIQPGQKDRWIFNREVARIAAALIWGIEQLENRTIARLFRVLLGGVLVDVSNVIISGKGRRYRRGWEKRGVDGGTLRAMFVRTIGRAAHDIARYSTARSMVYSVFRGDARALVSEISGMDLAIYSPPYPNSFDYTDVYNVELWMLGYLKTTADNRLLREATLSSHVQIGRKFVQPPSGSLLLDDTVAALDRARIRLWDPYIPNMVGAYFSEMIEIISQVAKGFHRNGRQWIVVGDSRYAGVQVPVGEILSELVRARGLLLHGAEPFRSMRAAPQQGGKLELNETLLVIGQ